MAALHSGAMERIKLMPGDNALGLCPLDTEDGTIVIVVEHGMVEVGRYHAPSPPERPHPAFERPSNADALRNLAYQTVLQFFPGTNITGKLKVFSCPESLAERAFWAKADEAPGSA